MTRHARLTVLFAVLVSGNALLGCSEHDIVATGAGTSDTGVAIPASLGTLPASRTVASLATKSTVAATTTIDRVPPATVIDGGTRGLATGAKGPAVAALENRLIALRFNAGKADGTYDGRLAMAVMAFQKQQGLPRSGRADPATLAKIAGTALGTPMVATGDATRVEIDLKRQIAQFWKDGRLIRVLAVSTGNGAHYCVPKDKGGGCDTAITPGGSYRADRKIAGQRVSALGTLYDPVYFYGGLALHGSPSIPAVAASHGCVRVPMWESEWVYNTVNVGDPVYVVGGKNAPVPFAETAPVEAADEVTVAPPA